MCCRGLKENTYSFLFYSIQLYSILRLQRFQNVHEEKDIRKKKYQIFKLPNLCDIQLTYQLLAAFVFVPSVFEEKFPTDEF